MSMCLCCFSSPRHGCPACLSSATGGRPPLRPQAKLARAGDVPARIEQAWCPNKHTIPTTSTTNNNTNTITHKNYKNHTTSNTNSNNTNNKTSNSTNNTDTTTSTTTTCNTQY